MASLLTACVTRCAPESGDQSPNSFDIVIVGGGVCGGYALQEFYNLKLENPDQFASKSLLVITNEGYYPYERPALTKGFLLKPNKVDLPMFNTCAFIGQRHEKDWYETEAPKNNIFVQLNVNVESINYDAKSLIISKSLTKPSSDQPDAKSADDDDTKTNVQETVTYDKLIIATGTRANKFNDFGVEGSDASNLYYIRDYVDAVRIRDNIITSNVNKDVVRVVIIGGGYVGMETGAALMSIDGLNLNITFTFPENNFMEVSMFKTVKNTQLSNYYTNLFKNKNNSDKNNITFINGKGSDYFVTKFETNDNGKATSVVLKDGTTIEGDYFVAGIGAKINDSLFKDDERFKYEPRQGLPVNGRMETNISGVYGCGDIVRFPCNFTGRMERYEHVRHARASASQAIKSLMSNYGSVGDINDYEFIPQFYSRLFNAHWESYGDSCNFEDDEKNFNVNITGDSQAVVSSRGDESNETKFLAVWSKNKIICGIFFESGVTDEKAKMKRELLMNIVKTKKNVDVFGKWHSLNENYAPDFDDFNNVDALVDHLATQT